MEGVEAERFDNQAGELYGLLELVSLSLSLSLSQGWGVDWFGWEGHLRW